MPLKSVDLIYLDPPFQSNRDYNGIYKDETGRPLPDQIEAFCDTWTLNEESERAARTMPVLMREAGVDDEIAEFWRLWMNALRKTNPKLLAYLVYMTQRLLPMRGLLKPTGSIYLHCDPTASHYIKVMMDAIFGHGNFLNDISWCYKSGGVSKRWFAKKHDSILLYARSKGNHVFHPVKIKSYGQSGGGQGGKVKYYKDSKGTYSVVNARDWWEISMLSTTHSERLGYATQKPMPLLKRIIQASSNPGDVVFDPFCGCATTIEAAHKLGRKWIGCDIAIHAIKRVASVRLRDRLGLQEGVDFKVEGVPRNMEGARDLWERDKYHFQKWAVEQVDGFVTAKRGSDGGIDGRIYFDLHGVKDLQSMVLEVKGGSSVGIGVVRDLRGVLERETAQMAGLIVMDDLGERKTRNFAKEMAMAGDLNVMGVAYPRMQMLTAREIFDGKRFLTPSVAKARGLAQPSLPLG
ncbi:MAG: DNA methyltransferase [Aestuariivita sp.]|nr:DNA methyltransferase [Aestuariivita sp.]